MRVKEDQAGERRGRKRLPPASAPAGDDEGSADVRGARRLAMLSSIGLCVGVALTATGELTIGPLIDAASLAAAILAAHKLGRTGPDPGIDLSR